MHLAEVEQQELLENLVEEEEEYEFEEGDENLSEEQLRAKREVRTFHSLLNDVLRETL